MVLLEELMKEFGKRLVHPPSDVHNLFYLLDRVEYYLSRVDQSPSKSMENSLCQLKKALVADDLMSHSDIDVRVAVASCISEVTRISAPVSPYDDEQMKKVFRLIVDAFEGLSDTSSRSYSKRVSILASMAKLRSCVVMLDLHCDAMIVEMFQHFLNSIRDYHPEYVFSDMVRIMILMLQESDDVFVDLLSPLLDSLQMKDKDVLPIRQKLANIVIRYCVTTLERSIFHHETVVATECNGAKANASGEDPANESKSSGKSGLKVTGSGLLGLAADTSSHSAMNNNDAQIGNGDSLSPRFPQKKPGYTRHNSNQAESTDRALKMMVKPETKPDQATLKTREVQNPPQRSFGSSNNRDSALAWIEAEERLALIEAWEKISKRKATYKALENLYAIESWENSKKAAFEAKLKRIEAEYVEKMKTEVALIHKEAEERWAMIQAKHGEEILKAEEIAANYRASETTPITVTHVPLDLSFACGLLLICAIGLLYVACHMINLKS